MPPKEISDRFTDFEKHVLYKLDLSRALNVSLRELDELDWFEVQVAARIISAENQINNDKQNAAMKGRKR